MNVFTKIFVLAFLLINTLSIMCQSVDIKTRLINSHKRLNIANSHGFLVRDESYEILHPNSFIASKKNKLITSQTDKQKLDSMIYISLDDNEEIKEVYTYDAYGNMALNIEYNWNSSTRTWIFTSKDEYTYDVNGNLITYIYYLWDDLYGKWNFNYKKEFTYDLNRNLTLCLNYMLEWVVSSKDEYTYDANGNVTLCLNYKWDESSSEWVASSKVEYNYDAKGNVILSLNYNWDESSSEWVTNSKVEYTYDINGNVTLCLYYRMDESSGELYVYIRNKYTYDASGNLTSFFNTNWEAPQWMLSNFRTDYAYDDYGNLILWNGDNYDKMEYTYDNSYSLTDLILPSQTFPSKFYNNVEEGLNHMLIQMNYYLNYDLEWNLTGTQSYYYSSQVATNITVNNKTSGIKYFPNPASDNVSFYLMGDSENYMINLYDMQGRIVLNQIINNNIPIPLKSFPKGMYLYKINNGGNIYTGKLLIE
jgi:hypothetical protein